MHRYGRLAMECTAEQLAVPVARRILFSAIQSHMCIVRQLSSLVPGKILIISAISLMCCRTNRQV